MGIYYSNTWNVSAHVLFRPMYRLSCDYHVIQSFAFPMLSTSLFASNGTRYPQSVIFGDTFTLNKTALAEVGLPALTGSNAWSNLTQNLAIGGLITHCVVFWGPYVVKSFKQAKTGTQPDRH